MARTLGRWQAVLLGTVLLVGSALAVLGLYTVGNRQWIWGDNFHVRTGFRQIRGIEAGTTVRVQGIEAGIVESVLPPATPGGDVLLRLRLSGKVRHLVRSDAIVHIASEGMLGGKALEITPGSATSKPVEEDALLASQTPTELTDVLGQVTSTLESLREGQGTIGKLLKDPEAYARLVTLLQQSQETMASFQQDADGLKRLPVFRGYVEDPQTLLVRANCEQNRQCFAESDLFPPGRAVLTEDGRQRLDGLAPWLAGLKHKGSEIVVVSYADPKNPNPAAAKTLTRQQSEAVCTYLKAHHTVQKMGWFTSRKVTALGLGTSLPPLPSQEDLPPDRVEVLVFVPQG
jgi:phospholipid/cholesterol/gamma-HCH transport system substrate-binding protein